MYCRNNSRISWQNVKYDWLQVKVIFPKQLVQSVVLGQEEKGINEYGLS